jgi:heme A synthase
MPGETVDTWRSCSGDISRPQTRETKKQKKQKKKNGVAPPEDP